MVVRGESCVTAAYDLLQADTGSMSSAVWIVVAVFAVGAVAGGLLRIRAWLAKPASPEVIEAAHRDDDKTD
ncbi:hypothetical protein MCHLDSM_03512 [Mycolicibacterium chlorophenolicum]|uniref:Uncharacterized protein n=1 Tax=Mycolicibacterium chlorophenolicum TaxID=37916 RepID=A0A0J6W0N1_9MYCO|nr:hypothetical protein MCHLDSM_03512 [Mycolicibacterium chlorophenolicum]